MGEIMLHSPVKKRATVKKGIPIKAFIAVAVKDSPTRAAAFLTRTTLPAKLIAAKSANIRPLSIKVTKWPRELG
jgi:hypothetical protein